MTLPFTHAIKLRRVNDGLSVAVVLLALYIFLLPLMPQIGWWYQHTSPLVHKTPVITHITKPTAGSPPVPSDNRLVISRLGLDDPLYEGTSVYTVNKGVWIRPNASTPDQGSNTVLVGHRFTYTNPRGVFYFLDKIQIGDFITVDWHGKAYTYQAITTQVVDPSDVSVEAPSTQSQLTLYTCTPLWSLKSRLVIVARLVQIS